ncbi:MAG TPA: cadmium-translocating P-type ATPase [Candidatus Onthocola gallistercoris]|uniref:Cd(2+)-exporting ATPase n=1 Tax=Candidatus Onthocola gallistercoris TaxID=2840876 RepID=A0A9D1KW51_9FIRM|nr:cadmium-translocating P-type ATPase [Candidatus Onthocola gallistercoris]
MTRKQKRMLKRIVAAILLLVLAAVLSDRLILPGYVRLILYLIPYLVIGYDVLRKAFLGVIHGEVFDENFLMAIATVGAMIMQEYGEAAAVMLFYQIGELFQSYAVGKSRKSITDLMDIRPDYANVMQADGTLEKVDPEDIHIGDVIVVKPGEKVPLDGTVLSGEGTLDTSALTGESRPRSVREGDEVISGCVSTSGLLNIKVSKEFSESTVARILDLVENSSLKKAKAENFITKFARYYTPAVCIGAVVLAIVPSIVTGMWTVWVSRALTFLVISCPCALVISIPLTFFGGIGGASRCGILVKGGNYLEALAETKTIVFDKTGTLTQGVFEVTAIQPAKNISAEALLETAVMAESYSDHPISRSLKAAYKGTVDTSRIKDVKEVAGHGVTVQLDEHKAAAGNARLMEKLGIAYDVNHQVGTIVYVALDDRYMGSIVISDREKTTARQAVAGLKAQGIRTVMLTGDVERVAAHTASELGIDEVHSGLLPADKVQWVEKLLEQKEEHTTLAFVGDGINDAPVLSRADIGIAMGALGSDAAIEAADIVLMDDDPAKIPLAMRISRKCRRIVYENIIFSLVIKGLFLILGAMGIANMWWAVFSDVGVMVLAVLNATRMLRIKKFKTNPVLR